MFEAFSPIAVLGSDHHDVLDQIQGHSDTAASHNRGITTGLVATC